jgi:hypothetical protein
MSHMFPRSDKTGAPRARRRGLLEGCETNHRNVAEAYRDIRLLVENLRSAGKSLRMTSEELNRLGHITRTGKRWHHVQVKRWLAR